MADALAYFGDTLTSETEKFVRYFDRFFDCLNVRSITEGNRKWKADLQPYRSTNDPRLKVSQWTLNLYVYTMYAFINYYTVAKG